MNETTFQSLAATLQHQLGAFPPPKNLGRSTTTYSAYMVRKLHALKLKMYQEPGHALPHIHVDVGPQHHTASYSISPAKRLEGSLDARSEYVVISWLESHKDSLLDVWNSLQDGTPDYAVMAELKTGA